MYWDKILAWESCSKQALQGVDITPVFGRTIALLSGKEEGLVFSVELESLLRAAQADSMALRLLDDWLTGLLLFQLGLSKRWGRKKLFQQTYACWSDVISLWAGRIGQVPPIIGQEELIAELRVLGCLPERNRASIKWLVALAVSNPSLERLRATIQREYHRVTRLLYPLFGYFSKWVDLLVLGISLVLVVASLILAYRFLVLYPVLSLSGDVSKQSMRGMALVSHEFSSLVANGVEPFGSRLLFWCVMLCWMVGLDSLSEWWIRRLLH